MPPRKRDPQAAARAAELRQAVIEGRAPRVSGGTAPEPTTEPASGNDTLDIGELERELAPAAEGSTVPQPDITQIRVFLQAIGTPTHLLGDDQLVMQMYRQAMESLPA